MPPGAAGVTSGRVWPRRPPLSSGNDGGPDGSPIGGDDDRCAGERGASWPTSPRRHTGWHIADRTPLFHLLLDKLAAAGLPPLVLDGDRGAGRPRPDIADLDADGATWLIAGRRGGV